MTGGQVSRVANDGEFRSAAMGAVAGAAGPVVAQLRSRQADAKAIITKMSRVVRITHSLPGSYRCGHALLTAVLQAPN
jgi:hypothetical protein